MTLNINQRAQGIALLILDVDGVLTDGSIYVDSSHESLKSFHVQDGLGIKLLQQFGVTVAIITGKSSPMVTVRSASLGIRHLYQNQANKLIPFQTLLALLKLQKEQVAYVGDDLPDIAVMSQSGLSICVANAHPMVLAHAHYQTRAQGGFGAVREVADLLLKAQGKLEGIYQSYLNSGTPA